MTKEEIIQGLQFTIDMFLFYPNTGETFKEPRNDMDKITVDSCREAIKALEQTRWIPVSERLPEEHKEVIATDIETSDAYQSRYIGDGYWECDNGLFKNRIIAWMPLPEPFEPQESENVVVTHKNLCDSCTTQGCIFQSGIVRNHCDFYKAESEET